MQQFLSSVWRIAASDAGLLRRYRRYALAVLVIAIVPALYALIYLTSVWDPNANTHALPVAIVNLDGGVQYRGHAVNVGAELTRGLVASSRFGFRTLADADSARRAVRRGDLAFAIVIPKDFSANAVPGVQPGAGKVTVILSEGNNYASAGFARRFAEDLGHQANEILNEQRWAQVLEVADGSGRSLQNLRHGIEQLRAGLQALESDLVRRNGEVAQLGAGVRQAGAELRRIEEAWPSEADLKQLRSGAQRLVTRQREVTQGIEQMRGAAARMGDGATVLQAHALSSDGLANDTVAASAPLTSLAPGAVELAGGKTQLQEGLAAASESNTRLGLGLGRFDARLGKLVDGVAVAGDAVHAVAGRLPQPAALDAMPASGKALVDATNRLRFGVEMAKAVLPPEAGKPDGSARGLADSVEPAIEVLAPVANNGSAFVPNMVAMALWLGAVMIVYVFAMQTLVQEQAGAPRLARALGKFLLPAATAAVQVLLILLTLVLGLGVVTTDLPSFAVTMLVSAWAFLAIVHLLVRAFGEAGKLLAVLLLTLQLAAGGGVLPIELSGGLFQSLHAWLPFTWAVRALRASLFGAFDNGWWQAWGVVAAVGAMALLAAAFVGQWKLVPQAQHRPPLDV
jgi:putative membrane protein